MTRSIFSIGTATMPFLIATCTLRALRLTTRPYKVVIPTCWSCFCLRPFRSFRIEDSRPSLLIGVCFFTAKQRIAVRWYGVKENVPQVGCKTPFLIYGKTQVKVSSPDMPYSHLGSPKGAIRIAF